MRSRQVAIRTPDGAVAVVDIGYTREDMDAAVQEALSKLVDGEGERY